MDLFATPFQWLLALPEHFPLFALWYTTFVRFLFPILAFLILFRAVRSLLTIPHTPEVWGQLSLPNGASIALNHWENIIGRAASADVRLTYPSISRKHAALCRGEEDAWTLYDLGSKGGTFVNGEAVKDSIPVRLAPTPQAWTRRCSSRCRSCVNLGPLWPSLLATRGKHDPAGT